MPAFHWRSTVPNPADLRYERVSSPAFASWNLPENPRSPRAHDEPHGRPGKQELPTYVEERGLLRRASSAPVYCGRTTSVDANRVPSNVMVRAIRALTGIGVGTKGDPKPMG